MNFQINPLYIPGKLMHSSLKLEGLTLKNKYALAKKEQKLSLKISWWGHRTPKGHIWIQFILEHLINWCALSLQKHHLRWYTTRNMIRFRATTKSSSNIKAIMAKITSTSRRPKQSDKYGCYQSHSSYWLTDIAGVSYFTCDGPAHPKTPSGECF